jgi:hypothetical protein
MGEQQNGGEALGRRRVHPGGIASAPDMASGEEALEALLSAAVLRGHRLDAAGEQRAVAAFRAARDAGAHRARTRRRDDWRPREQRRLALSVKTTLSVFVASLTLGGAAFAAIGTSGFGDDPAHDNGRPTPAGSAPDRSAGKSSAASGAGSAKPGHPATAKDTEAKCRAYDQVKDNGKALDSTAWERLVAAAGGADNVAAYCAEQLAAAKNGPTGKATEPTRKTDGGPATGNGQSRDGSTNGNGNSGKSAGKKD